MVRSTYILGGMELVTQHAETQKTNIYWTLVYIKKGVGMYVLDSDLRALNQGDIIMLPPKVAYSFCSEELGDEYNVNVDAVVLRFDDAWLTLVLSVFKTFRSVVLRLREYGDPYVVEGPKWMKLSTLLDKLAKGDPSEEPSLLIDIVELISSRKDMRRILKATPPDFLTLSEKKERIDRYITTNVYGKVSLEDVAEYLGMNRTYFCMFFRKHYGKGFADYLNDMRIEKAATMLKNPDYHIAYIARECGFKTAQYFTRAFRRSRGIAPHEFRKKSQSR